MSSIPREKIALVVFLAVIVLMVFAVGAYLFFGHSWNYAATRIDDATGEMEDYHVIVYEGTAIPDGARVNRAGELTFDPASISAARADYAAKGADVFAVDVRDLEAYRAGVVLERGGYRVGVLYAPEADTLVGIQAKVNALRARQPNVIVAFSPGQARLAQVEGVDVIVDLSERDAVYTEAESGAYCVKMPSVGYVGAITISPSDVVSSRTLPDS